MYPNLFTLPEWLPLVGGAPITSFGVMMLAAFLTAGYLLKVELARQGQQPEIAWDLLFWAVLGGIVGARIYYVLLNYPRFLDDPIGMLLSRAGMVWYGGFLLAGALVLRRIRTLGLPMGTIVDASAPALALAYGVGRLGCFLVGDDYGRPTDSWVGIAFPNGQPPTTVTTIESHFGITVDPALVEKYGEVVPVHPDPALRDGDIDAHLPPALVAPPPPSPPRLAPRPLADACERRALPGRVLPGPRTTASSAHLPWRRRFPWRWRRLVWRG